MDNLNWNTTWDTAQISGTPSSPGEIIGGRGASYAPNDPEHVYDNMPTEFGVRGPSTYTLALYNYGSFIIDDVHLKPGTTAISAVNLLYYNPGAGPTHTVIVAFFSNPGGADTSVGLTITAFAFAPITGFILFTGTFPQIAVPQDMWMGVAHIAAGPTLMLGGSQPVDGVLGTGVDFVFSHTGGSMYTITNTIPNSALSSARWIGDGHGFLASSAGSITYIGGNWHRALVGVPEPMTIGLIGLGGLLVLRRRRA
jgi:hypothetical protein